MFDGLGDAFAQIGSSILGGITDLPGQIVDALVTMFQAQFVPSDGFFTDMFEGFLNAMANKLPVDITELDQLTALSSSEPMNISVQMYGKELEIVDFDIYKQYAAQFRAWINGAMALWLVFYNADQAYRLIRGTSLYQAGRISQAMKGDE